MSELVDISLLDPVEFFKAVPNLNKEEKKKLHYFLTRLVSDQGKTYDEEYEDNPSATPDNTRLLFELCEKLFILNEDIKGGLPIEVTYIFKMLSLIMINDDGTYKQKSDDEYLESFIGKFGDELRHLHDIPEKELVDYLSDISAMLDYLQFLSDKFTVVLESLDLTDSPKDQQFFGYLQLTVFGYYQYMIILLRNLKEKAEPQAAVDEKPIANNLSQSRSLADYYDMAYRRSYEERSEMKKSLNTLLEKAALVILVDKDEGKAVDPEQVKLAFDCCERIAILDEANDYRKLPTYLLFMVSFLNGLINSDNSEHLFGTFAGLTRLYGNMKDEVNTAFDNRDAETLEKIYAAVQKLIANVDNAMDGYIANINKYGEQQENELKFTQNFKKIFDIYYLYILECITEFKKAGYRETVEPTPAYKKDDPSTHRLKRPHRTPVNGTGDAAQGVTKEAAKKSTEDALLNNPRHKLEYTDKYFDHRNDMTVEERQEIKQKALENLQIDAVKIKRAVLNNERISVLDMGIYFDDAEKYMLMNDKVEGNCPAMALLMSLTLAKKNITLAGNLCTLCVYADDIVYRMQPEESSGGFLKGIFGKRKGPKYPDVAHDRALKAIAKCRSYADYCIEYIQKYEKAVNAMSNAGDNNSFADRAIKSISDIRAYYMQVYNKMDELESRI